MLDVTLGVPHPVMTELVSHRHQLRRWRPWAAVVGAVRRVLGLWSFTRRVRDDRQPRQRIRTQAEWRRVAGACWADEGHLRVALMRAKVRGDERTQASIRRSLRKVVQRARRLLDELDEAQRGGTIDRSASRPPETLLRSVILAWEVPPDDVLDGLDVDRYRVPVMIDGGAVLPIEELDEGASHRRNR